MTTVLLSGRGAIIGEMNTPTITYIAAWATAATAAGTMLLAGATYWLGRKTRATADAAKADLDESRKQTASVEEQAKAVAAQTAAVVTQAEETGKQTAAAIEQAAAIKAQRDALAVQIELLREQSESAKRQSDAAEAALNASIEPLITDVPPATMVRVPRRFVPVGPLQPGTSTTADEVDASKISVRVDAKQRLLVLPVRNVGAGVARPKLASLSLAAVLTPAIYVYSRPPSVIASGQISYVAFSSEGEPAPGWIDRLLGEDDEPLMVEVAYTDIAGRQGAFTQFFLKKRADKDYVVDRVALLATPRFTDRPDPPSVT